MVEDYQENYIAGWISIFRSIRNHWIWKDPVKFQWWIDLLLEVNHTKKTVAIGYQLFDCERGECLISLQNWAYRWNVSKTVVNNFFRLLENDNMIVRKNETVTTRITICNYETYQQKRNANETQKNGMKTEEERKKTEQYTTNNYNNEKQLNNDKKILFDSFWELYPNKNAKKKCLEKWMKLKKSDIDKIIETLPLFVKHKPFEKYIHPHPLTYLNQERWNDEIKLSAEELHRQKVIDLNPV